MLHTNYFTDKAQTYVSKKCVSEWNMYKMNGKIKVNEIQQNNMCKS